MRPLDHESIIVLRKILKDSLAACPPYVIDYGHSAAVTNQSILLEWETVAVDKRCSQYHKLVSNTRHKLAMPSKMSPGWREYLFHKGGKFVTVDEVDPIEDTPEGVLVYRYKKSLIEYNWTNFELVEYFLERPLYMVYVQPKTQNMDTHLHMMGVFDQELNSPVGVFSNQWPRGK